MEERTEHDTTLARYLLGNLPEPDRDRIESKALADPGLFERLQVIEDDLIDAYVYGELAESDVALFEERFLGHPQRLERVEVARCLRTVTERAAQAKDAPPPKVDRETRIEPLEPVERLPSTPWLAWAASFLVLILGGWLALQNLQLGERLNQLEDERGAWTGEREALIDEGQRLEDDLEAQSQRLAELDAELLAEREQRSALEERLAGAAAPPRRPPLTAAFVLGMAVRGSDAVPRLAVPTEADRVELQLDVEMLGPDPRFRVLVANAAGAEVWGAASVEPSGEDLRIELPAAVFKPGRYILTLYEQIDGEFEEAAFFEFDIVRN